MAPLVLLVMTFKSKNTHTALMLALVVITGVLTLWPSRSVIKRSYVGKDHVVDWSLEETALSPARQAAFGLNIPVFIVLLPTRAWVSEGVSNVIFVVGVGLFWLWFIPLLFPIQHGPKNARWINVILLLVLVGILALFCVFGEMGVHHSLLRLANWTWLFVVGFVAASQVRMLRRRLLEKNP